MEKDVGRAPQVAKKFEWYLFIDDRYRGPYSFEQIDSTLRLGNLARGTLIWKEGMIDWEPVDQLVDFSDATQEAPSVAVAHGFPNGYLPGLEESALADSFEFLERSPFEEKPGFELSLPLVVPTQSFAELAPVAPLSPMPVALESSSQHQPRMNNMRLMYFVFGLLVFASVSSMAYFLYLTKVAFPQLPGVQQVELRDLERASGQNDGGPVAHLVLVPGTAPEPRFYVSSNLEDGSLIDIRAEGIPETLVDAFHARAGLTAHLKGAVTKTSVLRQETGKMLPTGEYNIRLISNGETIGQRTVFLGGANDANYKSRLNMYHAALRLQAEAELDEIRQLTDTLESQLSDTKLAFNRGRKGWARFHERWMLLQRQVEAMFKGWTTAALEQEFYHGRLYQMVSDAGHAVGMLHELQNSYVMDDDREMQGAASQPIQRELEKAEGAIFSLRAKIAQLEHQVASQGIPRRLTD